MRHTQKLTSLTLFALVGLVGCNDATDDVASPEDTGTTRQSLLMQRANSCQDLDAALREDAKRRLAASIATGYGDVDGDFAVGAGGRGTSGPVPPAQPEDPSWNEGGASDDVGGEAVDHRPGLAAGAAVRLAHHRNSTA